MIAGAIIALVLIFMIAGIKASPYFWFFSGASMWGLGAWLIHSPLVPAGDPVNDIVLTICFIGGFALMAMMGLRAKGESAGINFRLPRIFGGMSEEEESSIAQRRRMNYRDRASNYTEKLNRGNR